MTCPSSVQAQIMLSSVLHHEHNSLRSQSSQVSRYPSEHNNFLRHGQPHRSKSSFLVIVGRRSALVNLPTKITLQIRLAYPGCLRKSSHTAKCHICTILFCATNMGKVYPRVSHTVGPDTLPQFTRITASYYACPAFEPQPRERQPCQRLCIVFLSPSMQILGQYLKIPRPLSSTSFSLHRSQPSFHSTLHNLHIDKMVLNDL